METEAEIGGMLVQAKEHLESPEARRGKEGFPYVFQREHGPADTLSSDFWPPEL